MYISVDVDIDDVLCEVSTSNLIAELKSRDYKDSDCFVPSLDLELLERIHRNRLLGEDYQFELDKLLRDVLGKAI
jgi:branched-subunit amino acid aminotransferase/4-amino-4-deoxychorismate lyase